MTRKFMLKTLNGIIRRLEKLEPVEAFKLQDIATALERDCYSDLVAFVERVANMDSELVGVIELHARELLAKLEK